MAARATFDQCKTGHIEMEAFASDLEELAETSSSFSTDLAGQDQAPAGLAAGTPMLEEQGSQRFPDEEESKGLPLRSSEEGAGQASSCSPLSFPQKLWVLAESEQVKSIRWGHGGSPGQGSACESLWVYKREKLCSPAQPLRLHQSATGPGKISVPS